MTVNLEALVRTATSRGASDLHVDPGAAAVLRVRGDLQRHGEPISERETRALAESVLGEANWHRFVERGSFDLSRTVAGVRCRFNVFVSRHGIALAIRLLARRLPTLRDLNLHPDLAEFVERRNGLILVSGATGAGKSSTLAALVNELNLSARRHIITVEEPIEFAMESRRSFIQQREVGTHTPSFQQALLDVLREDPDVVMVGEMRDSRVMQLTLNLAETGHLVLATVHSSDTAEAIQRITGAFLPEHQSAVRAQLAEVLIAVIAQRLAPLEQPRILVPECEVLTGAPGVRNLVRQGHVHKLASALATGAQDGMYTWERYRAWVKSRTGWHVPSDADFDVIEEREPSVTVASERPAPAGFAEAPSRPLAEPSDDVVSLERPAENLQDLVSRMRPPGKA